MTRPLRRGRRGRARDELITELRRGQLVVDGRLVTPAKSAARQSLARVDLSGADLRWADLQQCDLRRADLSRANLDGADLSWASLDDASLQDAFLGTARVVEAVFRGANLDGADLSSVTGLTATAVRGVTGARNVRWPPGFDPAPPRVAGPLIHRSGW